MCIIVTEIMKLCKVIFSFFAKFYFLVKIMPILYSIATKMYRVIISPIIKEALKEEISENS